MPNEKEEMSVLGQLMADDEIEAAAGKKEEVSPDVEALQRQLLYEKQRNDSLQGRVDSQLRPLTQTVRDLQQKLQGQAAPEKLETAAVKPVAVTVQDLLGELTPADRELVGEKQLAIMARLIEKPTQAMVDKVRAELQVSFDAELKTRDARLQQVEGQAAGQTGREMWDRVDQLSPGARAHNDSDDPQWVEYLNQVDPVSGRLRKELGNAAVDAGDVSRLALLHDDFLKSTGQDKKKDDKPAGEEDGLNTELRPDGSRAEPPVGSGEKPTIKGTEVTQFYKELSAGKYEKKPELREKMEALITEAIQDGRVV